MILVSVIMGVVVETKSVIIENFLIFFPSSTSEGGNVRGLIMGIGLCILCQFSGAFTIINYAVTIFEATGSKVDPRLSGIILGVVQVFGTYVSALLVDNVGRRPLLIISSIGSVLGLSSVGAFAYLFSIGVDVSSVDWIPVVSLSFALFISNVGLVCLPFVMLTEMLPTKLRTLGCSMGMITMSGCAFLILKSMPILITKIHIHGCMWIFAGVCAIGLVGIICFVPETKGKVLNDEFGGGGNDRGKSSINA